MRIATREDIPALVRVMVHPDVRRWIGKPDATEDDLRYATEETFDKFLFLISEEADAFFMLDRMDEDGKHFELHTAAKPYARGAALKAGAADLVTLLETIGAKCLWTWIPSDNRRARVFASICGMRTCDAPENWDPGYKERGSWMQLTVNSKERAKICP